MKTAIDKSRTDSNVMRVPGFIRPARALMAILAILGMIVITPLQAQSSSDVEVTIHVFEDVATVTIETESGSFVGRGRLEAGDFGSVALTPLNGSVQILIETSGNGLPQGTTGDGTGPDPVNSSGSGIISNATLLVESFGAGTLLSVTHSAEVLVDEDGFGVIVYEHDSEGAQEVAIGFLDRD